MHILYCQCYFYSVDTGVGYQVKLFDMVKPDDHPSFDFQGKTSLWIDDIQWSPNDLFCLIALRSRDIAIMTRLGSLVRFIVHPSYDVVASMKFNTDKFNKTPSLFNQLVYSRDAQMLDRSHNEEKVKIMFENDKILVKDNRVFFIFEFTQHHDIITLLGWWKRSELSFNFLKLCLSHELSCTLPENLERIPVLLNSKLPQFEFEKNAEIDELEDDVPAINTPAQIKPFEITKSQLSNESFNEDFNLDPEVLLSNFNKFLMSLRWTKFHPKNFKEWFFSIVDDCFYFCLKMNEPVYAYHLLKISKSFMQNYLYKLEEKDKIIDDKQNEDNFNIEELTIKECLGKLSKGEGFSDSSYNWHTVGSMFEYEEWKNKEFANSDIKLEGNKNLSFHKNYALLVFYGLIQFRNYQANNFNILFLAFSCNILKKHFSPLGAKHISRIVDLVFKNYDIKDKSDEYDMFLGKSGKNRLEGKDDLTELYKSAISETMFNDVLSVDNFDNYMATWQEFLAGNYERVLNNLSYLEENGEISRCICLINQNKINDAFIIIRNLASKPTNKSMKLELHDFALASWINLISESLCKSKGNIDIIGTTCISFSDALNIYLLSIKSEKTSNFYTFSDLPFENITHYNVITRKQTSGLKQISKFLYQNSREMALILCFYVHRIDIAKNILFKYKLNENLDKTYFDFLLISSVSKYLYKQMSLIDPEDIDQDDEFSRRLHYKKEISGLFSMIKTNLYEIIDQNLK